MKTKASCVGIVLLVFLVFGSCGERDDFSVLKGPYLGQTPPGTEPEIFAPGLITTHNSQSYIAFLNEARVCVYSAGTEKGHETYYTFEKNGHWTVPQRAPFEELQGHPNYTTGPLGRKVYFHSGRPTHKDDIQQDDNIWTIEWTGSGWAELEVLPEPPNSDYGEAYPSATVDGTVYFFTWRRPNTRGDDIWVSRCAGGQYKEAERLPWPINTDFIEYDPYVAPDESFLIFGSTRPGGYGKSDNYICFRKENGIWSSPINLGLPLNSSSYDLCANGTPDGKFFFFTSGRKTDVDKGEIGKKSGEGIEEDSDLYWVDFSFINDLKNTVLTKENAAENIKQDYVENGIHSAVDTLNRLYSSQRERTYFSPFELLSLCKNMLTEDKTEDADLFFSALDGILPEELSIKEGYAHLCVLNGQVSYGLRILEELEPEDPYFDMSNSLSGLGYLLTLYPDKIKDALSVLQFTVEKFPEDPFAYYSLARVYQQLGDLDNAIASCKKALDIRPSVGDVSQLLERLLQEQKEKKESLPVLRGPYLGQKPPGKKAELFAPEVITYEVHGSPSISPDEKEILVGSMSEGMKFYKMVDGIWQLQKVAPFDIPDNFNGMFVSPSGKRLYFLIWENGDENFYISEKKEKKWTKPRSLGEEVNSFKTHWQFSVAKSENLYFSSEGDIMVSVFQEGEHLKPVPLKLNSGKNLEGGTPYIAPDESYLLYSMAEADNDNATDLYISYRANNGKWSLPKNLGSNINSPGHYDLCPKVSPNGKFLFFISRRKGPDFQIYWADAKIIEESRPKELK